MTEFKTASLISPKDDKTAEEYGKELDDLLRKLTPAEREQFDALLGGTGVS